MNHNRNRKYSQRVVVLVGSFFLVVSACQNALHVFVSEGGNPQNQLVQTQNIQAKGKRMTLTLYNHKHLGTVLQQVLNDTVELEHSA